MGGSSGDGAEDGVVMGLGQGTADGDLKRRGTADGDQKRRGIGDGDLKGRGIGDGIMVKGQEKL